MIAHLPLSELEDVEILSRAFCAAVPIVILIGAIAVHFSIRFIVFLLIGDEIAQRKAIMGGDEVDAAERRVSIVERLASTERCSEPAYFLVCSFEKSAHVIAIAAIPFRPGSPFRERAELVESCCIPCFCDKFDLINDWVFSD